MDDRISAWLEPLPGDACGPDIEYEPTFLELQQAVLGKAGTQFAPAEPPSWVTAREMAEALFLQTRDLRVAMLWARASVSLEGLEGLAPGLNLLYGLLDRFWENIHPQPDDGDTFARLGVLDSLQSLDGLLGDVRQAHLINDRRLGGLQMRDVEIALDKLPARADETPPTAGQIAGMLTDMPEASAKLTLCVDDALQSLKALQSLMNERFGIENAVDLKTLKGMLAGVQSLLPSIADSADAPTFPSEEDRPTAMPNGPRGNGVMTIESRQDAVRAINLICTYLEKAEPTNPARMLLRRAERLIDKDFLQLVRDLAPEAAAEVARVLGIDPDSSGDSGSY